jgi:transposase InsO family protein
MEEVHRYYWWPNMDQFVRKYVSGCKTCTQGKPAQHPKGPLQPLEVPKYPWQIVGVDLVGPLPLSDGFDMIITYVDLLTKQAHFLPCNSTITAEGVADMHVKHIFPLHGTPEKFISDRRPQFAACMMSELYRQLGIKHAMSSAFHPQSNGQTEQTNQEIVKYLRMFCSKDQQGWAKLLPIAEFAYNLHVHLVTKSSPFEMLYGYQPTWNTPPSASAQMPSVSACLLELHKARDKAKAALRMSKEAMIRDSEADRSQPVFSPSNMVWLDSENIKIQTKSKKLVDK